MEENNKKDILRYAIGALVSGAVALIIWGIHSLPALIQYEKHTMVVVAILLLTSAFSVIAAVVSRSKELSVSEIVTTVLLVILIYGNLFVVGIMPSRGAYSRLREFKPIIAYFIDKQEMEGINKYVKSLFILSIIGVPVTIALMIRNRKNKQ